ncbi:hypothetical protein HGR00_26030 [Ralstonia insidiosa]|uniref:Uncharacterized protein n=2 Tax=Ralstonia insidiosa TaxID=190721 RepID=A0A848P245_9RALS|nr:hypothetical protein [Ralstonia insidiosa]
MRAIVASLAFLASSLAWAGYDVHITRKAFWADTSGERIPLEQWKAYVLVDSQVVNDPANGPTDFLVTVRGATFPLWYNAELGELYTKNPTDEALHKLEDIARAMRAKVQGDDGELYPAQP